MKSLKQMLNFLTLAKNEKKPKNRSISWSQLLLPSYKTRLVEFRKLFAKSVPINERLIADFSCALQKEILIQGRLYLSINYISFHANIFGWETVVSIKFTDIQAITKANTIRVIPNAIQIITTTGAKYIFTSFVARDKAFKRIYRLWQDVMIGQKMSVSEVWQLIHYNYGNYLGVPSDSEEDDEELSVITRNNMNIVEEELDDEVFNDTSHTHRLRHKKRESISSFLTCPESDLEEQLNHLDAFGGDIYDNNNNNSNNNSHFIPKLIKITYHSFSTEYRIF
ncbi:unnamed protein product [Oppiella nova]|uniref:GRAM domain-containing protein n=1 Tax=Oppiella nova TaxID=334625 RepID=A0A7R9LEA8_9ACAR|nr:unnamed protein product [Oppiella nova]CAG2162812.1 unnamed protein product [Oppiella nova]